MEPWHFTQTAPAAVDDPEGVVLDQGRRRVRLTLANAAHGCVFLLRTASGASCCGLGALAPASCRLFPWDPTGNAPTADPTTADQVTAGPMAGHPPGCRCRERMEPHPDEMDGWAADQAHWRETVTRWNRQYANVSAEVVGIADFQRYLLEAQTAREAGTDWPEEVAA